MLKTHIAFTFIFLIAFFHQAHSQSNPVDNIIQNVYIGWGWNRAWYTKSDIHFMGNTYDFDLQNVVSKDRPSKFNFNDYFNPKNISIPQYNLRLGYVFKKNYDISFGVDHEVCYGPESNSTS